MSTTTITISSASNLDKVDIMPIVSPQSDTSSATLLNVYVVTSENSSSTAILETPLVFKDAVGTLLTKFTLSNALLQIGKFTYVGLRYLYSNGKSISSNILGITLQNVPTTPVANASTIRSEDGGVSINIGTTHTKVSSTDGYSAITKMIVYISKVGSTSTGDFFIKEIDMTGAADYAAWVSPPTTLLTNAMDYEIAYQLENSIGRSILSNTFIFSPKDTPSQIANLLVYSLLTDQTRQTITPADVRGDIVLYFDKPDDYNNLITNLRPVTKYEIIEQEYALNNATPPAYVASGSSTVYPLTVPAHSINVNSGAAFELATKATINLADYYYKYVIPGSASRLGKTYKYTVSGYNLNGAGPISAISSLITSFKNPDLQAFTLNHNNTTSNQTGSDITVYDGKMKINIASIASANGGTDLKTITEIPGQTVLSTPEINAGVKLSQYNKYALYLKVALDSSPATFIIDQSVNAYQDYTTSATVDAVTGRYIYTMLNSYTIDFDTEQNSGAALNTKMDNGLKYRFTLYRRSKNLQTTTDSAVFYSSSENVIVRTKFQSPSYPSKLQAYSYNDNITPVKTAGGASALRLVFNQLATADFNGMNVFGVNNLTYYAHQNSLPIEGLELAHDSTISGEREFIVPAALGTGQNLYIRAKINNTEINTIISAQESSPFVTETSSDYPIAVTGLTIENTSATEIKVSWAKQINNTASLKGHSSVNIQNTVYYIKDAVGATFSSATPVGFSAANQYVAITGLDTGASYKIFVVAEAKYTKAKLTTESGERFSNAIISANYVTLSTVVCGTPTAPTNIEAFAGDARVTFNYDPPSALNGVPANALTYNFFANKEATSFPNYSTSPNVLQDILQSTTSSDTILLTKAFSTKALSNNKTNAVDILNDTEYSYMINTTSVVGGNTLLSTSNVKSVDQTVNALTVPTSLTLVSSPIVPQRTIVGVSSITGIFFPSSGIPSAVIDTTSGDSTITVIVDKITSSPPGDLVITIEDSDAFDKTPLIIAAFDTRKARSGGSGGLFLLETAASNGTVLNIDNGSFLTYIFRKAVINGVTKYYIDFTNLVNGQVLKVTARYCNFISPYDVFSTETIKNAAAEAPPTTVQTPSFSVDSGTIVTSWTAPTNSGGAGISGNLSLQYEVTLKSSVDAILQTFSTSSTTYTFTGLTNGTDYKVTIAGFYMKANGTKVLSSAAAQANAATPNLIRPNPAPVGSTFIGTVSSGTITVAITTAASLEQNLYPLSNIKVYTRITGSTAETAVSTFTGPLTGSSALAQVVISSLFNGKSYDVIVRHTCSTTYSQNPPDIIKSFSPYGQPVIISSTDIAGSAGKGKRVVVNLNGSGPISNILGLVKASASNTIVLQNLSTATTNLPTITIGGTEGVGVAALQTATFDMVFNALSGSINDTLLVVVTALGSDTFVAPATGSFFA